MQTTLKILMLEDNRLDAEMVIRLLKRSGLDFHHQLVTHPADYRTVLQAMKPDIVLADNELPRYSATEALEDMQSLAPGTPFVMVTGTVSEEFAVSMIKKGADDYILKDRLERLPKAIESAINHRKVERERMAMVDQLRESEEKYRTLVEQAFDGILLVSNEGTILDANNSACESTGYSLDELLGRGVEDLLRDEDLASNPPKWSSVTEESPLFQQRKMVRKNGEILEMELVIKKQKNGNNIVVGRDITERINAQRQIEFDHNNLQALINNTQDLMWSMDKDYCLITSNEAFDKWTEVVTGIKPEKGTSLFDPRFKNFDVSFFETNLKKALEGNSFSIVEVFHIPQENWVEISFYPIVEKGEVMGAACFSRDITNQRRSAEEIRLQNERFEMVAMATNDVIWDWDLFTDTFWWNNNYYTHFGYDRETTPPDIRSWNDRVHPEDKERVVSRMFSTIRKRESFWSDEYRFIKGDGSIAYVMDCGYTLFAEDGKPYRMVGAMNDVTELRKLEQERLHHKTQEQRKVARAMLQGQEKERNQLGRELHDNISQLLAAIKMKLGFSLSHPEKAQNFLQQCVENIQEAITETRNLSHRMVMPRFSESTLRDEMTNLLKMYDNPDRKTILEINGVDDSTIPAMVKETLYRIAQEQMHNVEKYARASEVVLEIRAYDHHVSMRIEDNGVGFDTGKKRNGIGLTNIHNRAESFNGSALVLSEPGKGCRLFVEIPLQSHLAEEMELTASGEDSLA